MTSEMLRHRVGKTTLNGYLVCKEDEESFFPEPGEGELSLKLQFGDGQESAARLFRAAGKARQLKLAYTGEEGAAFRSWLKRSFPARKSKKARGILVLRRDADGHIHAEAESVSQASVDLIRPGGRRYFQGARPLTVLHPAMQDLEETLRGVELSREMAVDDLATRLHLALVDCGWESADSVGGGLSLPAGLRKAQAQLHLVLHAAELFDALTSLAVAFELKACDLGVLLVADERLSARIPRPTGQSAASVDRALREMEQVGFLQRGPLCLLGLGVKSALR